MKLSDYVVDFLVKRGISHCFFVSGGAVIHLIDSCARHEKMMCVCVQHEQHGAAAADMYARVSGSTGLCMATSGPGATNMLTSICNAYFDSVPMICITGQVARFRIKKSKTLRQRGFQETDVVSIFESVTKYAKLILDPLNIRYELEKAFYLAHEGRKGPIVLDIPDDLQREEIDPLSLKGFTPNKIDVQMGDKIDAFHALLKEAKRPVLILGAGVHSAQAEEPARRFLRHYRLPTLLTWGGADLLEEHDPLNMGRMGVCGPRFGNFIVQSADLVIALGTRLSQMITGGKQHLFAQSAKKIMVDIDPEELNKFGSDTFEIDLKIEVDLKDFFNSCENNDDNFPPLFSRWQARILALKNGARPHFDQVGRVDPHHFVKEISKCANEEDVIIGDTGANLSWVMQSFEFKKNQRIFSAWNHTPMGYALPASVGAAFALKKNILCLIGDGGLMMCMQELATIARHQLPIRIFIFDNGGHAIQRQTIDTWLSSRYVGVDEKTGLSFPDYKKLVESFRLKFFSIKTADELKSNLGTIWSEQPPFVCNVEIIQDYKITPMLKFGSGLEDLQPQLDSGQIEEILRFLRADKNDGKKRLAVLSGRDRSSV